MIGIVDMNNCYASIERVFDAGLRDKPLVVLSNNDGCVVARSPEAKLLGVKMGEPWHEVRRRHPQIIARSSNYELYADMSSRFIRIIEGLVTAAEPYSIDEIWIAMTDLPNRNELAHRIRDRIRTWLGLPVCVGIGTSKTRAKLSNFIAKRRPEHGGVFDLEALCPLQQDELLESLEVDNVWGVADRTKARLAKLGIRTVRQLRDAEPECIRQHSSVVLQRTVEELRGRACLSLELAPGPRKQLVVSRSFGQSVTGLATLQEAVVTFVSRAAEKLRSERLDARYLTVFFHTNSFREDQPQFAACRTLKLPNSTNDTLELAQVAARLVQAMYREGYLYKKAGVMLIELTPHAHRQADLFESPPQLARRANLNAVLDRVNYRYGCETLRVAGSGRVRPWSMKRELLSPRYTTRWEDVMTVWAR